MKDNYKYLPLIFLSITVIRKTYKKIFNKKITPPPEPQVQYVYTPRGTSSINYEALTVKELRYMASLKKIKKYSKLNKANLIKLLQLM